MNKPLNTTEAWRDYFEDVGLTTDLINQYIQYLQPLLSKQVPVIFSKKHLASLLGRSETYLASVAYGTHKHYRKFTIPKRRGGRREISAPYPALLECQRWILQNILSKRTFHGACHGYTKAKSILSNANEHTYKEDLLKIDIKDFFPSIGLGRVVNIFKSFGYSEDISFYLARLCTLKGELPQGAATSPALSNIISTRLDARLDGLAKKFKLSYTRYADDMTFSGEKIPLNFSNLVSSIIQSEGFTVNQEKTKLILGTRQKKVVTGLNVADEEVKIPRRFKRELRKELYFIRKFGYKSHAQKLKKPVVTYIYSLQGRAHFWRWIEHNNPKADSAVITLKEAAKAG